MSQSKVSLSTQSLSKVSLLRVSQLRAETRPLKKTERLQKSKRIRAKVFQPTLRSTTQETKVSSFQMLNMVGIAWMLKTLMELDEF